ncbi:MAG: anti-sigma factor family protein [Candidatus Scalinduaceae bacterium]
MDCQSIQKLIPVYLDAQLEAQELRKVKEHLNDCPHCQKEMVRFEKSWDLLSKWEDVEPEPGYISRFWERLSLERPWYERFLLNLKDIFTVRKPAFVWATVSMVIIVCILTFSNYLINLKTDNMLASMNPQDLELLGELELVQNIDIIENIDWLEDWEIIENLNTIGS